MAAKSKNQIKAAIDSKIIAKGNISAVDTNAILKDILDCAELNTLPNANDLKGFSFQGNSTSNRGAELDYSLRGISGLFVNITLTIMIKETNVNNIIFNFENKDIFSELSSIIKNNNKENPLDFLVKIRNKNTAEIYKRLKQTPKNFRVGSLNFLLNNNSFNIIVESQEPNDALFAEDIISTSFIIHSKG